MRWPSRRRVCREQSDRGRRHRRRPGGVEPGAELVGPAGRPVGGFVPARMLHDLRDMLAERRMRYDEAFSPDLLARAKANDEAGGEIPHDEVMRRLGLL